MLMLSTTKIFKWDIQYFKCETKPVGSGNISSLNSRSTCKQDFLTLHSLQGAYRSANLIAPPALIQQRCKKDSRSTLRGTTQVPKVQPVFN